MLCRPGIYCTIVPVSASIEAVAKGNRHDVGLLDCVARLSHQRAAASRAGHGEDGMLQWETARTDDGSTPAAFERAALHAAVIRDLECVPMDDCLTEHCGREASTVAQGDERTTTPDQILTPKKVTRIPHPVELRSFLM